jgi:hypothetical protein
MSNSVAIVTGLVPDEHPQSASIFSWSPVSQAIHSRDGSAPSPFSMQQ